MDTKLYLAALLALGIGALLLGDGLEGNVVSQSCCFGDTCAADYRCILPHEEQPASQASTVLGGTIITAAIFLFAIGAIRHEK